MTGAAGQSKRPIWRRTKRRPPMRRLAARALASLALPATLVAWAAPVSATAGSTAAYDGTSVRIAPYPTGVAVDPATGDVYVATSYQDDSGTTSSVLVVDGTTDKVIATVPVAGYSELTALAVDPSTDTVYATDDLSGRVLVIDGATSRVTGTIQVGGQPLSLAVNPATNTVYVPTGNGVAVIDGATDTVTATIPLPGRGNPVAVDPSTDRIYVIDDQGRSGSVAVIDGASNRIVATVAVGNYADGVAVDASTDTIFVADTGVAVIDGATDKVTRTIQPGTSATGVAVDPSTGTLYVTGTDTEHGLSVIDASSGQVVATIPTAATGVPAVNPLTGAVYTPVNQDSYSRLMVLAPTASAAPPPGVSRLAGQDRYGTAAAVAEAEFPGGVPSGTAILAVGRSFNLVDALTVAPLAKQLDVPVLLAETPTVLGPTTAQALSALGVSNVILVGAAKPLQGPGRLPAGIGVSQVISGQDRYDTAAAVAKALETAEGVSNFPAVFISSGSAGHLVDSLSADPAAASRGDPILIDPATLPTSAEPLPQVEMPYLSGATTAYTIGLVGSGSVTNLPAGIKQVRVYGGDRYATSAAVAREFFPVASTALVGNGEPDHLVDALVAGAYGGKVGAPVILTDAGVCDWTTMSYLNGLSPSTHLTFLGGLLSIRHAEVGMVEAELG